jgi:DNA-directed RNA polymerase alpha subunit
LFDRWTTPPREEAIQFNRASRIASLSLPDLPESSDLAIFAEPIEKLRKSTAYPYGLTEQKIQLLKEAGIDTVGKLVEADDARLDAIPKIGRPTVTRIRHVLGQALWM